MCALHADPEHELLRAERDRAERQLNALRAGVLVVFAVAAAAYGPTLSRQLNRVNVLVLVPMMAWTALQYLVFYRRPRLPGWLSVANPVADVVAVTVTLGGYGLAAGAPLALKSPMVLAFLVILAARPIATSARHAAFVAVMVVLAYVSLDVLFISTGRVVLTDPVTASNSVGTSVLDEGVKIILLAAAGTIATYATAWSERLTRRYAEESRERELLRGKLAASQLDTLRQQLNPHFLFNTLNIITALVHTDPGAAERMIGGLSELIRVALYSGADQEVPLTRELVILEHYLAIQRIRFEDRLRIETQVTDDIGDALVPSLVLQPLVENAIKHGIAPRASGGRIEVSAVRNGEWLSLTVADDGIGALGMPLGALSESVGLGNTRARLAQLYGERHRFELESPPEGGFVVRFSVPYRTLGDAMLEADAASARGHSGAVWRHQEAAARGVSA